MTPHLLTLLKTILPKSLIPLTMSGIFYGLGWILSCTGDDKGSNVFLSLQELLLNLFNNYFGFMLMILMVNISFKLWALPKGHSLKVKKSHDETMILDLQKEENENKTWLVVFKKLLIAVIQYSLAYCLWQVAGLVISTLFMGSQSQYLQSVVKIDFEDPTSSLLSFPQPQRARVLEEEEEDEATETPEKNVSDNDLDALSLSAGKILSSLNIDVESFVLAKNGSVIWVAVAYTRIIRSFNLSDLKYPAEMSTVLASNMGSTFTRKTLLLSSDEKTLFVSTFQMLDIIDISEIWAPLVLGSVRDMEAEEQDFFLIPSNWFYSISMALTRDEKYLFVAGIGLQMFDVKDRKAPVLLNTTIKRKAGEHVPITSLAISLDKKTLFYANRTLHAFDISDFQGPSSLKLLFSYRGLEEISSIALSNAGPRAYITGLAGVGSHRRAVMKILNISEVTRARVIKTYDLVNVSTAISPIILHVAPQESHVFLMANMKTYQQDLYIFNLIKGELLDNSRSLLTRPKTLVLTPDSRNVIASANNQFTIMKLNFIYPNTRAFSLSNKVMSRFPIKGMINSLILSSDEKSLFVSTGEVSEPDGSYFEIYNVSDPYSPQLLSSYKLEKPSFSMDICESLKRAIFVGDEIFFGLDISNLKDPKPLFPAKTIRSGILSDFLLSPDGNAAYVIDFQANIQTEIYDLSDLSNIKLIEPVAFRQSSLEYPRILVSQDSRRLFSIDSNLTIYNVTDFRNPTVISSIFVGAGEPNVRTVYASLSPNENLLAVITGETGGFNKLRLFNVTNATSPKHVSQTLVTRVRLVVCPVDPIFSPDGKKIFLKHEGGLLVFNISDPFAPVVTGILPVELKHEEMIYQFIMTKNNKIGYMITNSSELQILDLELRETLFLNQEQFSLGNKYSDGVKLFSLNSNKRFLPMGNDEYRFTKTGLFKISVNPTEYSVKGTLSALPDWISFDKDNSWVTIDPRKESDLGTYTIYSAFSKKIPFEAFSEVRFSDEHLTTEDLVTALISLGYLDTELFLTSSFASIQNFFLPSEFSSVKRQIFDILKLYYIEACTTFDILPSLSIDYSGNKIAIISPSTNPIRVDLTFAHLKQYGGGCAHFLSKTYGSLQPIMLDKKSELILEGSLKEVNSALRKIVVNIGNVTNCFGNILVNDNLNPMLNRAVANLPAYFIPNAAPVTTSDPNRTVQSQISQIPIKTGEYFSLTLHPKTFTDENADSLSYRLAMQDSTLSLPTWLSLEGLVLKGTPPEDVLGRDVELKLVAKNEYKESEAPFVLHVSLSSMYILKLCLRFSPYLLTFIGLVIGTNKIYNVLAKDRYKHTKDYYIEIGRAVNSNVIFPVLMVKDEARESGVIWKYFERQVCRDLGKKSIAKGELVRNFLNGGESLDKLNIVRTINKAVNKMTDQDQEKIPIYFYGAESHRRWIQQFIVNQIINYQCEGDKKTLDAFEKIKEEWVEFVDWDAGSSQFIINQGRFNTLTARSDNAMNTSLINDISLERGLLQGVELNGVNLSLLKDAIIAYAYECQTLDILAIEAQVFVKQKRQTNWLKKFLKFDLVEINLGNKFKVDYGIQCHFEDDCLVFSGKVHSNFKRKTLVIQIFNKRQRILKEVWIHENSLKAKGVKTRLEREEEMDEQLARGQSYAIF